MARLSTAEIADRSVLIYNTDVAASLQIADYYCSARGIPSTNKLGVAMGTGVTWNLSTPTEDRFPAFWTDLQAKITAVDAVAVLTVAGCPPRIGLRDRADGNGDTNIGVSAAPLYGLAPRITADGGEPYQETADSDNLTPCKHSEGVGGAIVSIHSASSKASLFSSAVETYTDAALTAAGTSYKSVERYKSSWDGDYSALDSLLTGWVGFWTRNLSPGGDTTLYAKSKAMIDAAISAESEFCRAAEKKILVGCRSLDGTYLSDHNALIAWRAREMGYKSVAVWTDSDAVTAGATYLSSTSRATPWDDRSLDLGAVASAYDYAFGWGFVNPGDQQTSWYGQVIPFPGGIFCGGRSNNSDWWYEAQARGAAAGWMQDVAVNHITTTQASHFTAASLAMLQGYTLAEACWLGREYSFSPVGDPLFRIHRGLG